MKNRPKAAREEEMKVLKDAISIFNQLLGSLSHVVLWSAFVRMPTKKVILEPEPRLMTRIERE